MGATAGPKTPLAGQARISQAAATSTPLAGQAAATSTNTDSYFDPVKVEAARNISQAPVDNYPVDDYFDTAKYNTVQDTYQKTLGRSPTQAELGKNYSSIGDLERSLQAQRPAPRPAPQPARRPSPFGVKRFR